MTIGRNETNIDFGKGKEALCLMDILNGTYEHMSIVQARIFFLVAVHGPIEQTKLHEVTGFRKSTISKTVHLFSRFTRKKEPGLGLLEIYQEDQNLRVNIIKLSKKGESFVKMMFATMAAENYDKT